MITEKIIIKNPAGLNIGPAGKLLKETVKYQSSITFQFGHTTANAKSLLSILGAGVRFQDEVTFICEGEDEEEAMAMLRQLASEEFL